MIAYKGKDVNLMAHLTAVFKWSFVVIINAGRKTGIGNRKASLSVYSNHLLLLAPSLNEKVLKIYMYSSHYLRKSD